ncbi:MAG: GAF domain-containing protein [Reichenbachiella sp.]
METPLDQCTTPIVFPFESKLSLTNVILFWQVMALDKNPTKAEIAKNVLKQVDKYPDLNAPIDDLSILEINRVAVDLLMNAIISPFSEEEEVISIMTPFKKEVIRSTKKYSEMMELAHESNIESNTAELEQVLKYKIFAAYGAILDTFYNAPISFSKDIIHTLENSETGLKRFYRIDINPKFCEIIPKGDLPTLDANDIAALKNSPEDLEIWYEKLPPALFEFQGVVIFKFTEVTKVEVVSRMKENLLQKDSLRDENSFNVLENMFRSLLQQPELKLGISGYSKERNGFINFGNSVKRSILFGEESKITCSTTNKTLYDHFVAEKEAIIIENAKACFSEIGGHAQSVLDSGVKNLILSPLYSNGEFVGMLELASPNEGDLDATALSKIKEVLPLIAIAVRRNEEEVENSIRSIIKQRYTSIHPTVEWKFKESAIQVLDQIEEGSNAIAPKIVFKDVYPLYAASDIRNSSIERNRAINRDLKLQLKLAKTALIEANEFNRLPILDETIHRIDQLNKKIKSKLVSGDEAVIIDFLQKDVEPLIRNFEENYEEYVNRSKSYWSALDAEIGVVYLERRNFEESLTKINDTITGILDVEEEKAQLMFPHFFERYKTDGVEHNIYIGNSLVQNLTYSDVYLKNLRLWQLVTTAEIAIRTASIVPELALPLETSHLVLVHSNPLAISFRQDEKKFDVDGAYNIRYEITKKRIDKALVKGTDERITQPGKIAIIYSQDKDAKEYTRYINYLLDKNLLTGEIEELEVEDLQGVSGLKALRISVNIGSTNIIEEVKKLLESA